ncbi:unnamed protein product, partial [Laminaria digitata]
RSLSLGWGGTRSVALGGRGGTLLQWPQSGGILWSLVFALPRASRLKYGYCCCTFSTFLCPRSTGARGTRRAREADTKRRPSGERVVAIFCTSCMLASGISMCAGSDSTDTSSKGVHTKSRTKNDTSMETKGNITFKKRKHKNSRFMLK